MEEDDSEYDMDEDLDEESEDELDESIILSQVQPNANIQSTLSYSHLSAV